MRKVFLLLSFLCVCSSAFAGFRIPDLTSCNTIDTDSNGVLACGTDETSTGGVGNTFTEWDFLTSGSIVADSSVGVATIISTTGTILFTVTSGTDTVSIDVNGNFADDDLSDNASTELTDTASILYETELDSESELEAQLTDVTNVFTNNDGALDDDDLTDNASTELTDTASILYETELDSESELEAQLTDVTNVFTNNDGALDDDDLTDNASTELTDTADILYETELDTISELNTQITDATLCQSDGTNCPSFSSGDITIIGDCTTGDCFAAGGAGSKLFSTTGVLTLGGVDGTNNENLHFDFESDADRVTINTTSGVGAIIIDTTAGVSAISYTEGATADPCGDSVMFPTGTQFYNSTSNYFCYCDGSNNDIKMNDNSTACF